MAKIEVEIIRTSIVCREGVVMQESPASLDSACAKSGLIRRANDDQGVFRIDERGRLVKVDEPHT
ncbi:MAG: hypothetical protein ACR2JW_11410 [Thermomicrobiales bacterium]